MISCIVLENYFSCDLSNGLGLVLTMFGIMGFALMVFVVVERESKR